MFFFLKKNYLKPSQKVFFSSQYSLFLFKLIFVFDHNLRLFQHTHTHRKNPITNTIAKIIWYIQISNRVKEYFEPRVYHVFQNPKKTVCLFKQERKSQKQKSFWFSDVNKTSNIRTIIRRGNSKERKIFRNTNSIFTVAIESNYEFFIWRNLQKHSPAVKSSF